MTSVKVISPSEDLPLPSRSFKAVFYLIAAILGVICNGKILLVILILVSLTNFLVQLPPFDLGVLSFPTVVVLQAPNNTTHHRGTSNINLGDRAIYLPQRRIRITRKIHQKLTPIGLLTVSMVVYYLLMFCVRPSSTDCRASASLVLLRGLLQLVAVAVHLSHRSRANLIDSSNGTSTETYSHSIEVLFAIIGFFWPNICLFKPWAKHCHTGPCSTSILPPFQRDFGIF
ncbi:hypothetical protein BV898_02744 [Hypsibius exemplaris]|uniref:Uncharacterized protein n=1 Tax=Hypsibius exemplaris TaxID=2072580 RepID=A0A1W0X6Z3_HYPEX|nr:hypothetical protein BV898_02744 [Hypsibius exemplaris]